MFKNNNIINCAVIMPILCVLTIVVYLITTTPPITDSRGLIIIFLPTILGIIGFVFAILRFKKSKNSTNIFLIICNLVFVLWIPVFMMLIPTIDLILK